jgi:Zn-dependent peptidase ImmA (M78 family)
VRRGFKSEAEVDAARLRRELGLADTDRLDPFALADYLGIPVFSLQRMLTYGANPYAISYFKGPGRRQFSATSVTDDTGFAIIVYNERHSDVRQCSNVCHELAHIVLFHEPTTIVDSQGRRFWDAQREDEASWMGATLLVPRSGLLALLDRGAETDEVADIYGVSLPLLKWRVQMTGVSRQLEYRAAARRSRLLSSVRAAPTTR